GLLTASIVILIMFLITDDSSQAIDSFSVEELSSALEDKGYRTISQDDFISFSVYLDETKTKDKDEKDQKAKSDKQDKDKDSDKEKEKSKEKGDTDKEQTEKKEQGKKDDDEKEKPKSVTITVKEGFVSQDIGEALKDKDIIKDSSDFVKYMEDNGYSAYIQIGKFKVNSDMSLKELAETLTTYPGS